MSQGKSTLDITVRLVRRQLVTFSGKTLGSVRVDGDDIVVNRKRPRGRHFDNHYFDASQVAAYVEGDGGKDSPAYAVVMTEATLRTVTGQGIIEPDSVKIVDADGQTHVFSRVVDGSTSLVITEETGEVDPAEDIPAPRRSAAKQEDEFEEEERPARQPRQRKSGLVKRLRVARRKNGVARTGGKRPASF